MAEVIEGEGLEQEVVVEPKIVPREGPLDDYSFYQSEFLRVLKAYTDADTPDTILWEVDPQCLEALVPYVAFSDVMALNFKPIPKDEFASLLGITNPTLAQVIRNTDIYETLPDDVIFSLCKRAREMKTDAWELDSFYRLAKEPLLRTAASLAAASRNLVLIPTWEFASLYITDQAGFMDYVEKTQQEFSEPFLAFPLVMDQPRPKVSPPWKREVFSLEAIAKYSEKGGKKVMGISADYDDSLCSSYLTMDDEKRAKFLAKSLKEKHPGLFYG